VYMTDVFSEVLQHIRLTSCVYFQRDFYKPWGMRIENTGFAQFHVITRGTCVVRCDGQSHECSTGDILLFPHGLSHVLADDPKTNVVDGPVAMASFGSDDPMFSEGCSSTRVICGHYEYSSHITHPLINELPEFIHVKSMDNTGGVVNISILPLILSELSASYPGQSLIVERFAEILFVQTIRAFNAKSPFQVGFYAGLSNARLARAITYIHREYASPLSLSDLAAIAAMSRASFAQHFKSITGISPIEYLAKWRMIIAGNFLKTTTDSVADIAEHVGYGSEISFARAFKRAYGVTPSSYRK
jgi:AraC-like DNA-binding protein